MGTFLSRDLVESEPAYQYVRGNPVNSTDPSGHYPPELCKAAPTKFMYRDCVLKYYNLEPTEEWWMLTDEEEKLIEGTPGCDLKGPILYRGPGYLEGYGFSSFKFRYGEEIVYDFATMEKAWFKYDGGIPFVSEDGTGGISDGSLGVSYVKYIATVEGFRSSANLSTDYSESAHSASFGGDFVFASIGNLRAWTPDRKIRSEGWYAGFNLSDDPLPLIDVDFSDLYFTLNGTPEVYAHNGKVELAQLLSDIDAGNHIFPAPHPSSPGYNMVYNLPLIGPGPNRDKAKQSAIRMAKVYEEIHSAYE